MIEFFRKLFAPTNSSQTAKERLRLVLMTDHLSLAPDMIEQMKRDFIDVIAKYVEVDRDKIEINFEQQDKALAMLANVPILAVNRNGGGGDGGKKREEPATVEAAAATGSTGSTATPALPRRRRRKKSAPPAVAPSNASPAPAG
ncbi:MAG TPA: cell division topological specificity factor MinE [Candidatus Baltobacteraceae bacterium]